MDKTLWNKIQVQNSKYTIDWMKTVIYTDKDINLTLSYNINKNACVCALFSVGDQPLRMKHNKMWGQIFIYFHLWTIRAKVYKY